MKNLYTLETLKTQYKYFGVHLGVPAAAAAGVQDGLPGGRTLFAKKEEKMTWLLASS